MAVLNQAQRTFAEGLQGLPQDPTNAQVAALADPYAHALEVFGQALVGLSVPDPTEADVEDLVADNGVVRDDLQAVADLGVGDLGRWSDRLTYDLRQSTQDAAHVRRDLHLPPNAGGRGPHHLSVRRAFSPGAPAPVGGTAPPTGR